MRVVDRDGSFGLTDRVPRSMDGATFSRRTFGDRVGQHSDRELSDRELLE